MSLDILSNIAFCTFSTSRILVREVLGDWFSFLGGKPGQVIFAVSPCADPPPVYEELRLDGLIDQIIYLEPNGRSIYELDAEGIRVAIEAANTDWILLAKLDTLPFREGHESWLDNAIQAIQHFNCLGLTGAGSAYYDVQKAEKPYSKIQKFSNNFSIIKRKDWLNIQDTYIGRNFDGPLMQDAKFSGAMIRVANEEAIETFLRDNQCYMLVRWQTLPWSVFHVNVWGENLRQIRELYIARKNVKPYLFTGKPHDQSSRTRPWIRYYGYPKPSWIYRLRYSLAIRTRLRKWYQRIFKA
jgi:hypothetical protein